MCTFIHIIIILFIYFKFFVGELCVCVYIGPALVFFGLDETSVTLTDIFLGFYRII